MGIWRKGRLEKSLDGRRIKLHTKYSSWKIPDAAGMGPHPFFTFLPRERNEGLGDVHAMMGKVNYKISPSKG